MDSSESERNMQAISIQRVLFEIIPLTSAILDVGVRSKQSSYLNLIRPFVFAYLTGRHSEERITTKVQI